MKSQDDLTKVVAYFTEKLETHGATHRGVDYNSEHAQDIRFEQLVRVIAPAQPFSLIDYGCGYGALFDFLYSRNWRLDYYGFDLSEEMIARGCQIHAHHPNCFFTADETELPLADYLIAGSIFNIKLESPASQWQEHVLSTLCKMDELCTKGFSFNMLTKYSDTERMSQRPDLFFADPCFFFDYCKRRFSKNVALLHDYALYDFTVLVRKDL